ncbi:DM13 domain-containing protein [Thermoleptolyngbya sp. C42_A2020_037]|uniref:DM13 domain-containing protein n=1 Tax=Thermoleptolyngbya sp. C42_A2020_037 TaxID=2747799 RepID=UPI001A0EEBA6|nr:DM13 domain-containing protein [Thermoleptolyngbya sp. C42_A2020_037]MBF2083900.1 DM13 domain-containing protein [Thermoleptolyngbya sp. C42_A2020_037]
MQLPPKSLRLFGLSVLTSALALAASTGAIANPPAQTRIPTQIEIAQQQVSVLVAGVFKAAEAPTTGNARIVVEGGQRYLEFDSTFSTTDQALDLHVVLDTDANPPQSYSNLGRFVNLGSLHSTTGSQRYPIPDSVNVSSFKSAVIWCRMANATIGYATLGQ